MKDRIKQRFFELNNLIGVSGQEQEVAKYCRDALLPYADKVEVMVKGNVIATFNGKRPGPTLMIAAHMDEIGFVVKNITDDGFVLFELVGGMQKRGLPGSRILFKGDHGRVLGVFGSNPQHLMTQQELANVPEPKNSFIDVGAHSRQEVEEMGIHIGTTAVFDGPATEMNKPYSIVGRACDDRSMVAIMIELGKELKNIDFAGTIQLTFTVQEEVGTVGAPHAVNYAKPDCFLALDTFMTGGTPGFPPSVARIRMGEGPAISLLDGPKGRMIQGVPNVGMLNTMKKAAKNVNVNLQFCTMLEAAYYTDSNAVQKLCGIPCLGINLPKKYSHSPIELFDIEDCVEIYNLLAEYVTLTDQIDFSFLQGE